MTKNLIPEIAKMLGVELGEEFNIKDKHGEFVSDKTYKFSENAFSIYYCQDEGAYRTVSRTTLQSLLNGKYEIVKIPWKPKKGDIYYSFNLVYGTWVVCQHILTGSPFDYALLDKGWVYRTCEEAKAALPAVAEEMGVKYEL